MEPQVGIAPADSTINFTNSKSNSLILSKSGPNVELPPPFAGQPSFSLGPIDVHAGNLVRQFRVRQKFGLTNRLSATAGLFYDFQSTRVGPTASLVYKLDSNPKSKSRIELTQQHVLLRKGWEFTLKKATVGVSAECSLKFQDEAGKTILSSSHQQQLLRPDLHLSLDHVEPFQYELIGIGLVLLLNLPLKLNNKEAEAALPWGLHRLKAFGIASLRRTGYTHYKLAAGEASGVLDL
eukprot:gene1897-2231_t